MITNNYSHIIFLFVCSIVFSSALLLPTVSFQTEYGKLEVTIRLGNGERAGPYGSMLKIYSVSDDILVQTLLANYTYPYFVTELPLNQKYKIETYVNDQLSDTLFFTLDKPYQRLDTFTYYPIGLGIRVLYDDGETPIQNAKIELVSHKGTIIAQDYSDMYGKAMRMWVSPSMNNDEYYQIKVSIADGFEYVSSKIKLFPGVPSDVDVVTPWPEIINSAIQVNVEENKENKILNGFKKYVVSLYDNSYKKISQSSIDHHGRAFFSQLPVGNYFIQLENKSNSEIMIKKAIPITNTKTDFSLIMNNSNSDDSKILANSIMLDKDVDSGNATQKCCVSTNIDFDSGLIKKQSFALWADKKITDNVFADDLKPLLTTSDKTNLNTSNSTQIPNWIQNPVEWWLEEKISDKDFVRCLEYLVERQVIIL